MIRRRLKSLEIERSSDRQTPKAGYTHSHPIYHGQISHADSIYLSLPLVHPCRDTFNYITGHRQQVSATLHNRFTDDTWTSFPEIEIMDSKNTFSFNVENTAQKVFSYVEITVEHPIMTTADSIRPILINKSVHSTEDVTARQTLQQWSNIYCDFSRWNWAGVVSFTVNLTDSLLT